MRAPPFRYPTAKAGGASAKNMAVVGDVWARVLGAEQGGGGGEDHDDEVEQKE